MLASHPHDISLPTFSKPEVKVSVKEHREPSEIAQAWIDKFSAVLASGDGSRLAPLIHSDSWWRDYLTLTWDFRTIRGAQKLVSFLSENIGAGISNLELATSGKFAPHFETPIEGLEWVESMFSYENKVGKGKGMIRLAQGDDGVWKAHFISTSLQELKDYPEAAGHLRPLGGKNSLEGGMNGGNWFERRERQKEFLNEEPTVFIVGAGTCSPWAPAPFPH
jgi:hypothetical protein